MTAAILTIGIILLLLEEDFGIPEFTIGIIIALIFCINGIYVNNARLEFDDEKLIDVCFRKKTVIYYKDIVLFGIKKGLPKRPTYHSYWIIKTKDKIYQPELQLTYDNTMFENLINSMKKSNPEIIFDFGKTEYSFYNSYIN